jgi:hypothetical protein
MYTLLDMFGGFQPTTMVPSARVDTPTSYMRLDERLRTRDSSNKLPPDAHYPDTLFKSRWPEIERAWGAAGPLPDALMASLVDVCRTEKRIVEHTIKYKLSLDSHRISSAALKKKLADAGIWDLALRYVAQNSGNGKSTGDEIKAVLRKTHKVKASTLQGLHVPELVQMIISSAKIAAPVGITDELSRGRAIAEATAAAAVAAAAALAVSLLEAEAILLAKAAPIELDDALSGGKDDDTPADADVGAAADDASADDAPPGDSARTSTADAPPPIKRARREGLRAPTTRTHRLERALSCITR